MIFANAFLHENGMKTTGKKKPKPTKQNSMNKHYLVFVFLCYHNYMLKVL